MALGSRSLRVYCLENLRKILKEKRVPWRYADGKPAILRHTDGSGFAYYASGKKVGPLGAALGAVWRPMQHNTRNPSREP